jgi:hypothetical protein
MNDVQTRRKILILVSAFDLVISGIVLLIYFGLLPIDISSWGIPRWVVGLVGGIWFLSALAILTYQLTRTDISE